MNTQGPGLYHQVKSDKVLFFCIQTVYDPLILHSSNAWLQATKSTLLVGNPNTVLRYFFAGQWQRCRDASVSTTYLLERR
jgi:hypothetical protein